MFGRRFQLINTSSRNLCSSVHNEILKGERINKMIASTGYCSRRDAEKLVNEGLVIVNGIEAKITTRVADADSIWVEGIKLKNGVLFDKPLIWMVHKLKGELVGNSDVDGKNRPLMHERIIKLGVPKDAITINRLEFNVEGLCLLTNNHLFARFMENAASGCSREYKVRLHGLVTDSKLDGLRRGMVINGVKFKPMQFELLPKKTGTVSWAQVVISENRSRVLKTCFEKLYLKPLRVIATGFGPYKLGDLPVGAVATMKMMPELKALFLKYQSGMKGAARGSKSTQQANGTRRRDSDEGGGE